MYGYATLILFRFGGSFFRLLSLAHDGGKFGSSKRSNLFAESLNQVYTHSVKSASLILLFYLAVHLQGSSFDLSENSANETKWFGDESENVERET